MLPIVTVTPITAPVSIAIAVPDTAQLAGAASVASHADLSGADFLYGVVSNNLANGEATAPMHQVDRRFGRGRPGNGQRINGI